MTPRHEWRPLRGLLAGLLAAAAGAAVPWVLLELLLLLNRLGTDLDPSRDGARLGSYFLGSIAGVAAFASFATAPRGPFGRTFAVVGLLTAAAWLVFMNLVHNPRRKGDPLVGEDPMDLVWLTAAAVAAGVGLLVWRALGRDRPAEGPRG